MHLGSLEECTVAEADQFATGCPDETIELGWCPLGFEDRDAFQLFCVAWDLDRLLDKVTILETLEEDGHILRHTDDGFVRLDPDVRDSGGVLLVRLRLERSLVEHQYFACLSPDHNAMLSHGHFRNDRSGFKTLKVKHVMGADLLINVEDGHFWPLPCDHSRLRLRLSLCLIF